MTMTRANRPVVSPSDRPRAASVATRIWLEAGLTAVGLWTVGITARVLRRPSTEAVNRAAARLAKVLDLGPNWLDLAPSYGAGVGLHIASRALIARRHKRPRLFITCGPVRDWSNPGAPSVCVLRPHVVRARCEEALRELDTDCVDGLFLQGSDCGGAPLEAAWLEVARLVDEGKVCWAGLANQPVAALERCRRARAVDVVVYDVATSSEIPAPGLHWARDLGVPAIVRGVSDACCRNGLHRRAHELANSSTTGKLVGSADPAAVLGATAVSLDLDDVLQAPLCPDPEEAYPLPE